MTGASLTQLLEDALALSTANFLGDNAAFFARLLFDNMAPRDPRESLARYYVAQGMHLQAARLLQNPASEIERYLLGVALFHLGKYDEAVAALLAGAEGRALADFLRESQQKAVETVFLDQPSPNPGSEAPLFETDGRSEELLSPEIKRRVSPEGFGRLGAYRDGYVGLKQPEGPTMKLREGKTPPRRRRADGGRKVRQKPSNFRGAEFAGDCVANGASGFYFLGLCFERKGKLEEASMCFRNGYQLEPRLFHAYVKFVELASKIEFQKTLRDMRMNDERSFVDRLTKETCKKRKPRKKGLSSARMMSYLLQNNLEMGLLRRRDVSEAEIPSPAVRGRTPRAQKRLKGSADRPSSEFLVGCHSALSGLSPNSSVCPADRILSGLVCKKENQETGPKIGPKMDHIVLTEFRQGLGKPSGGFLVDEGDCLNVSHVCVANLAVDDSRKSHHHSQTLASGLDRPNCIFQKENADVSLEAEGSQHLFRFDYETDHKDSKESKGSVQAATRRRSVRTKLLPVPHDPLLLFLNTLKPVIIHFAFHEYPDVLESASPFTAAEHSHPEHRCSFAVVMAARSAMNKMDYTQATRLFELAQRMNPNTPDGLDYYSSCLWYNRSIGKLLELERKTAADFPGNPIDLVIRGNSFSLVKKTEEAVHCFRKALKRRPSDSYVLCLLGHEHMFLEDLTGATRCYWKALQADPLQFNAHWGLGNIAKQRDESIDALVHFYNALAINPHCSLLYSYIGLANLSLDWNKKAIENFERAETEAGNDAMNSYYKAMAMFKLNDLEGAARVLEALILTLKKEPKVYVLLGKIYHKMGKMEAAHDCFLHAINLDPRDSQGKIRELSDWINAGTPTH